MKSSSQYIGTMFLALAGIIFFIHSVIPHHHHNEQVFLDLSYHLQSDNYRETDADKHSHNCDDHRRPTEKDYSFCLIKQLLIVPDNQCKLSSNYVTDLDTRFHESGISFKHSDSESIYQNKSAIRIVPRLKLLYIKPDISSVGLRAPPAGIAVS